MIETPPWTCPDCDWQGTPVVRVKGYPSHEDSEAVEQGKAVYSGCLADDWEPESHQCGDCGAGVEWDEKEDED